MSRYVLELVDAISGPRPEPVQVRTGTVTGVGSGTVNVQIGDGTVLSDVHHLDHVTPGIGDVVLLLRAGGAVVIIGRF